MDRFTITYIYKRLLFEVMFEVKYPAKKYIQQVVPQIRNIKVFHRDVNITDVLSTTFFIALKLKLQDEYCKLPKQKIGPVVYSVRVEDDYGYKGACWRYITFATSDQNAIEKTIRKINKEFTRFNKVFKYAASVYTPYSVKKEEIGVLEYFEGDERL